MTADRDRVITLLEQLLDAQYRTNGLLEAMASANEPTLYCPPGDHCPGGVALLHHAPAYWKNDGKDQDRFYHPLPERDYFTYTGEGAFKGATVRNHNVWRSAAIQVGGGQYDDDIEYSPFLDDGEAPAPREATGAEAQPRAAAGPPRSATAAPARADGPPVASELRIGQWLTDVLRDLRMNGSDVREAGGFARSAAAAELLAYPGGLPGLYAQCEQWAIAKGRIQAPAEVAK
jgi:hypothetical protein